MSIVKNANIMARRGEVIEHTFVKNIKKELSREIQVVPIGKGNSIIGLKASLKNA